jgi:uncharacterized cupin superfamily protein
MQEDQAPIVVNVDEVAEEAFKGPDGWTSYDKRLTPALPRRGHLGVCQTRVPPGHSAAPFHTHQIEDEVFFILSGRGLFRYGEQVREVGAGDAISCRAGTGVGHQIANPFGEDLLYLAIGMNDPNEVCTYPDSGQILVRSLQRNGFLKTAGYFDGQPAPLRIMTMPRSPETGDE